MKLMWIAWKKSEKLKFLKNRARKTDLTYITKYITGKIYIIRVSHLSSTCYLFC